MPMEPSVTAAIASGPRMTKLKALTFDRRAGSMLKTWNPAKPDPEDKDKPKEKPAEAVVEMPEGFPQGAMVIGPDGQPMMMEAPIAAPGKKKAEEAKLDKELEAYKNAVQLGQWDVVKTFYGTLWKQEAKAAYAQLLKSLANAPMDPNLMNRGNPIPPAAMERNIFFTSDLLGLVRVAPEELSKDQLRSLGGMLRQATMNGIAIEHVVAQLKTEVTTNKSFTPRHAARLLAAGGHMLHVGGFLPEPAEANTKKDLEALNLLARHYLEKHASDKKSPFLEKAWEATLAILGLDGPRAEKEEAIKRAVELAPRVREELGQAWLDTSYNKDPDRGKDILATLGGLVSQGIMTHSFDTEYRLKELNLQKSAVESLLKAAPKKADEWSQTLSILAAGWLREADYAKQYDRSTGYGSSMRRDMFGNFYYYNTDDDGMDQQNMFMRQQGLPYAIKTAEILKTAPSTEWLQRVDAGLKPKVSNTLARLYLKVAEDERAFPYIESLASTHPDQAKDLVKEFLRVWTKNHDPNAEKNQYRNSWIYFYGFETRAESIPLTRSKQERNLEELAGWVNRLRKLNLGELDEEQVAKAFTACHSTAEVYRTAAIEKVFGPIQKLKPTTVASLSQTMRTNLAGIWRLPSEQEKKKTKRKQKDIESEVKRGYTVAIETVEDAMKKFPDHWALTCAKAAILHDQLNYEAELSKSSKFSARREYCFELFAKSAEQYAKLVSSRTLSEDEETTQVYDQWFYASLGGVDLSQINEEKQPAGTQPPLIRKALTGLPKEAAKRHMDKFANNMFTRMSSAKPQIKFRYLKHGFEICDPDHRQAHEAKKVHDYYKDLVKEIELQSVIDGSTAVGHGQPFGVFVNIRHTRDIERESGGFGRYLQNQNSLSFSYNYGRPTADYRERFETTVREAVKEHFELVSVTFQSESVHSRADREFGWRVTPYAYVLLKPRGPQVDKLPPLRLDLDFLDTSGYVVLPIETPIVPINCQSAKPEPRPCTKLSITQTLDERQADKGKLVLEVKASGVGLVGPLESILDLNPSQFTITKTDDNSVAVTKYDDDGDSIAIVSERSWTIAMEAKEGRSVTNQPFEFAKPKGPTEESIYQRYRDADVIPVTDTIVLEKNYGQPAWYENKWVLRGGIALATLLIPVFIGLVRQLMRSGGGSKVASQPTDVTPFNVIATLERVRASGKLSTAEVAELDAARAQIEAAYFAETPSGAKPDLAGLLGKWDRVA
ncbi:MAG: hypothetical protein ACRCZF_09205 [Gemmataceae bacterium]